MGLLFSPRTGFSGRFAVLTFPLQLRHTAGLFRNRQKAQFYLQRSGTLPPALSASTCVS